MFLRSITGGAPLANRSALSSNTQVAQSSRKTPQELVTRQLMDQTARQSKMAMSSDAGRDSLSMKKLMVITGATGEMGPGFIVEALKNGFQVLACTRNPSKYKETPYLKYVQTPEHKLAQPAHWESLLEEHAAKYQEVALLNLLGASVPPKGKTYEDINLHPVTSAMEGMIHFRNRHGKRCSFQHLSSIAATIMGNDHPYSRVRKLADEMLLEMAKESQMSFTSLRPGLIFNELRENHMIHMGHAYSPEQLASLPVHLVLGSGKQIQQPVFEKDLYEAMLNATEMDHQIIVDAVGPDTITQKELFKFFADLANKTFRPLHIPTGVAKAIAEYCPKGRFAPYAMQLFETLERPEINKPLSDRGFKQLVGRETMSLQDVYHNQGEEQIVLARPPVLEHASEIFLKMIRDSKARNGIMGALWTHRADLIGGMVNSSHYEDRVQQA